MSDQKILIVDDDPNVIQAMTKCLEEMSFKVSTAKNGLEGLNILRKEKIDLALVDWRMPEMDGLSLVKQVKGEKIPTAIVIMTGYGSMGLGIRALKAGAAHAVEKPLGFYDLQELLKVYLPAQNLWRDSFEVFFERNYRNPSLSLNDVVRLFGFSKTSICTLVKKHLGKSFTQKLTEIRLANAQKLLLETSLTVTEIAYECGFSSRDSFGRVFKKGLRCSPSEFRKINEQNVGV